jgi:fructokinase
VSSVGDDLIGCELLDQLQDWGISAELIGTRTNSQTGRVNVSLDRGLPTFDIVEDVAWDYIGLPESLPGSCQPIDAVVYGSLAQRSAHNRETLQRLFDATPESLKVFDVNLRPPFDAAARIRILARDAGLIKLNDEEAAILLDQSSPSKDIEASARALRKQTGCERICITAGSVGGGLLYQDVWHWVDSVPVQVRDTVGAGDSFLAALVQGLLVSPERPEAALQRAVILASFVAGSDGATPAYTFDELI